MYSVFAGQKLQNALTLFTWYLFEINCLNIINIFAFFVISFDWTFKLDLTWRKKMIRVIGFAQWLSNIIRNYFASQVRSNIIHASYTFALRLSCQCVSMYFRICDCNHETGCVLYSTLYSAKCTRSYRSAYYFGKNDETVAIISLYFFSNKNTLTLLVNGKRVRNASRTQKFMISIFCRVQYTWRRCEHHLHFWNFELKIQTFWPKKSV